MTAPRSRKSAVDVAHCLFEFREVGFVVRNLLPHLLKFFLMLLDRRGNAYSHGRGEVPLKMSELGSELREFLAKFIPSSKHVSGIPLRSTALVTHRHTPCGSPPHL